KYSAEGIAKCSKLAATPHYANVDVLEEPAEGVKAPTRADSVITAQNYHDFHNLDLRIAACNRRVYEAPKPGGTVITIDRVEPAGFVFAGSRDALHNPADPHDVSVFDKSIRGHTDQFIYRFRKPAR